MTRSGRKHAAYTTGIGHIVEGGVQHVKVLKGWDAVDKRIRDSDERKVEDYKEDVDTLLVFAGLFSAVTTALLIESYKFLQEDQTQTTNILLAQVYLRLVNGNASVPTSTLDRIACISTASCLFSSSNPSRRINYLWFSSLILSLVTASFGMLVKQWLREYLSGNLAVGKSHLRLRFFRYTGMMKWRVFKIASLLPLLLQLALALFFAGLCLFAIQIDSRLGTLTTSIVVAWACLFALILWAPLLSQRCPYKVTFLKEFMHYMRILLGQYLRLDYDISGRHSSFSQEMTQQRQISTSPFEEEAFAVNHATLAEDMDILLALDCEMLDDGLLETGIAGLLVPITSYPASDMTQVNYGLDSLIVPWVLQVIENRLQNSQGTRLDLTTKISINGQLSIKAWTAVVDMLSHVVLYSMRNSQADILVGNWIADSITILMSDSGHSLPINGQRALSACFRQNAEVSASIICAGTYAPRFSLFQHGTMATSIGKDAFHLLLECGIDDTLRHLHGDDLLHVLHELLSCRYGCSNTEKNISTKSCMHKTLPEFLSAHVYITTFPRVRLDHDGGFHQLIDILLDDLENVFETPPSLVLPSWILTAVEVVFTYFQKWGRSHSKRIINWTSQNQTLLWYLQLAKPAHEDNDLTSQNVSRLVVSVTRNVFTSQMNSSERKVMLRLIADILMANCDPHVLEDPSILRIDHLGLCELLLDLLRWQLQAPPDPIQSMQRALMNAWRTTLERLADAIRITDNPATDVESVVIRRIISLLRTMDIPPELKLNKAMDALLSSLGTRQLGPAASIVFQRWKLLRRSETSGDGSSEAIPSHQLDGVDSLPKDNDSQSHVNNHQHNEVVARDQNGVTTSESDGTGSVVWTSDVER